MQAADGEPVTLSVVLVEGSEPVEVVWQRDGLELPDSAGFRYSRVEQTCSLTIADAFPEDSGAYACQVC